MLRTDSDCLYMLIYTWYVVQVLVYDTDNDASQVLRHTGSITGGESNERRHIREGAHSTKTRHEREAQTTPTDKAYSSPTC